MTTPMAAFAPVEKPLCADAEVSETEAEGVVDVDMDEFAADRGVVWLKRSRILGCSR
jgi:hypothetical protein